MVPKYTMKITEAGVILTKITYLFTSRLHLPLSLFSYLTDSPSTGKIWPCPIAATSIWTGQVVWKAEFLVVTVESLS